MTEPPMMASLSNGGSHAMSPEQTTLIVEPSRPHPHPHPHDHGQQVIQHHEDHNRDRPQQSQHEQPCGSLTLRYEPQSGPEPELEPLQRSEKVMHESQPSKDRDDSISETRIDPTPTVHLTTLSTELPSESGPIVTANKSDVSVTPTILKSMDRLPPIESSSTPGNISLTEGERTADSLAADIAANVDAIVQRDGNCHFRVDVVVDERKIAIACTDTMTFGHIAKTLHRNVLAVFDATGVVPIVTSLMLPGNVYVDQTDCVSWFVPRSNAVLVADTRQSTRVPSCVNGKQHLSELEHSGGNDFRPRKRGRKAAPLIGPEGEPVIGQLVEIGRKPTRTGPDGRVTGGGQMQKHCVICKEHGRLVYTTRMCPKEKWAICLPRLNSTDLSGGKTCLELYVAKMAAGIPIVKRVKRSSLQTQTRTSMPNRMNKTGVDGEDCSVSPSSSSIAPPMHAAIQKDYHHSNALPQAQPPTLTQHAVYNQSNNLSQFPIIASPSIYSLVPYTHPNPHYS